jgi:hypothetical protein
LIATLLVAALAAGFWYVTSAERTIDERVGIGEIEAATAAVEAWGSFAATGDLSLVEVWFAVDGPQYAQLLSEVDSILPGGIYDFALADSVVIGPGLVRGSVTVTGGGGESQVYLWDIELVQQDGHWKVWTVRTQPRT